MISRARSLRTTAAFLAAATVLAGCSTSPRTLGSSTPLTPAGTVFTLPPVLSSAPSSPPPRERPRSVPTLSELSVTPSRSTTLSSRPETTANTKAQAPVPATSKSSAEKTADTIVLSARESADRRAIEAVWVKYWDIYVSINDVPATDRSDLLSTVSADPIKSRIIQTALDYDLKGYGTYGRVFHRSYWGPPIDGQKVAMMGDCLDTSKYGSLVKSTKAKRTVGVSRVNVHGVFMRGKDNLWRVEDLQLLEGQSC